MSELEWRYRFPEFLTGARYEAMDGGGPGFSAIYQVNTLGLFDQPRYRSLRTDRSAREADILARIGTLDRRTYRSIHLERRPSSEHNTTYHPHILTVELTRHSPELLTEIHSFEGWIMTQVGQIHDSSVIGHLQPPSTDPVRTPRYIFIFGQLPRISHVLVQMCAVLTTTHLCPIAYYQFLEFMNQDYEQSCQLAKLAQSPDQDQAVIRKWKLARGWQNSSTQLSANPSQLPAALSLQS